MEKNPINLFQNQVAFSPTLVVVERYLRVARYVVLSLIFGIGLLTLSIYFIFQFQKRSLDTKRQVLYQAVQKDITKEAMLLSLRARVSALKKIMAYQISIAPYIDTTLSIAAPPRLSSFSLGEGNSVHIEVDVDTITEAVSIVQTVIQLANEHKIKNPTMTSIILNKDAKVTLGFTYTVVLQ